MEIASLPGFREFFPEQIVERRHIFGAWHRVASRYGFQAYDGPPLEPLELYTRKSGPEIVEQLYGFTDKGGRQVALRPEMTPTFARMVSARARALPKPIRWYSVPQLFRYERPQRGRLREHFQLNMDIVGDAAPLADAEVVSAALAVCRELGLTAEDVVARLSDRRLLGGVLRGFGVPEERLAEAFAALDRVEREAPERVVERLGTLGVERAAAEGALELVRGGLDGLEAAGGPGVSEAAARLRAVLGHLEEMGWASWLRFDAGLVRGLAYYTGLVFEVWERSGELRAVCGGGRYDDLLASLGGEDLPAAGFGMGDVVLAELLRDRGLAPGPEAAVEDFVVYVSEAERPLALRLVEALRARGRRVAYDLGGRSVGRQFKAADQAGATNAWVVGPDEAARGVVLRRSMATGEEEEVPLDRWLEAPQGLATGDGAPEAKDEDTGAREAEERG